MGTTFLKKYSGLLIVFLGIFFSWNVYQLSTVSHLPFGSYHAWRQADCISMTNRLHEGKGNLLAPQTHYSKADDSFLAAGEFPIVNVIVSASYSVFGKSFYTYRIIVYLFYIIGMIFLYLLLYERSKNYLFSALLALLLGSGSVLIYYSINFLPDVPALCFCITGLYFITIGKGRPNLWIYGLGSVFLLLSALIKISCGIVLCGSFIVLIVEMIFHGRRNFNFQAIAMHFVSVIIIFIWYYHAYKLDHSHPPFIFLTETRSYWNTYFSERPVVWHEVIHTWLPQVYLSFVWVTIFAGAFVGFIISGKNKVELLVHAFVSLIISALFFLLMYRQFMLHDYLWIGLLPVLVLFGVMFAYGISFIRNKIILISIQLFLFVLVSLQIFQTSLILKERYFNMDSQVVYNHDLLLLQYKLSQYNIKKQDKVISIPDVSPNISLVAMDQPGVTNYREKNLDSADIMQHIQRDFKYLVISDKKICSQPHLKPFIQYRVFEWNDIQVFDLRPLKHR